jgi:fucose permease
MPDFLDEAEQPLLARREGDNVSQVDAASADPEKPDELRALARIIGCCISAASAGWHDGCIGALIPYLQLYYGGLSDEKISLIFIGSFTGYTLASLLNVTLNTQLGLRRLLVLGAAIQGLGSAIIAFRPPFIAIPMCFAVAGFGIALQDAQYNTYVARLPGASTKLGIVHALYGVGALASPVAATLLMKAEAPPPLFYFTNLAWCVASMAALLVGFVFGSRSLSDRQFRSTTENDEEISSLRTVISSRVVWTTLLFVSLYTGAETGEAGWIVSFLMRDRDGGAVSGYASAAFYGGLTSGRVMLLPLTAYISEKKAVPLYALIGLIMQVIVWTVPSFLVDIIAVAACGLVMGPLYPITVSIVTKATPHGYHPGALSLMACLAQSGSALFPFLVGSLADLYGIKVLQPILITLFGGMILLWQLVPFPKPGLYQSSIATKPTSVREGVDHTPTDSSA